VTQNLNIFGQEIPRKELFHYTSMEGLKGVISGRTLWASNIEFLNDSSEFRHGETVLQRIVKSRKRSAKGDRREFFNQLEKYPSIFDAEDVFLVSLSEADDLLSQWRGYTPNGLGYSIGFDPVGLARAANALDHMQLVRCLYDEEEQQEFARELLDECLDRWLCRHEKLRPNDGMREFSVHPPLFFRILATFVAACLKHATFAEEREWRLLGVCRDHKRFRFRPGRSALTPYIELTWGGETNAPDIQPVSSVTVGPCPNPDLSRRSVKRLLNANGAEGARVKDSRVPFRAW
jgi:Protein of unknown function (DUF2971)